MTKISDILMNEEEELEFSSPEIPQREQKTKDFFSRFGDNWMTGGNRIVQGHKDLADTYQRNLDDTTSSAGDKARDLLMSSFTTASSDVMTYYDMVIGSPLVGLLGDDGTAKEKENVNDDGILAKLGAGMEWAGQNYADGAEIVGGRKLSKTERENAVFVGGEGLAEAGAFGAIKGISKVAPYVYKGAKQIVPGFKPKEIQSEIIKQIDELEKTKQLMDKKVDKTALAKDLTDLYNNTKIGKTTMGDIDFVANKFGIKDSSFFKETLEKSRSIKGVDNSSKQLLFSGFYKTIKPSKLDALYNKLDEGNVFEDGLARKKKVQRAKALGINAETLNEVESVMKNSVATKPETLMDEIYSGQTLHRIDGKEINDTIENPYKTSRIVELESQGLVKVVEDNLGRNYLRSVQWTKKGEKFINDSKELTQEVKDKILDGGYVHIPKKVYDYVKGTELDKIKELQDRLVGGKELKELGKLMEEKLTGSRKTVDLDLINTIHKISERYKIPEFSNKINTAIDSIDGYVNPKMLKEVVEDIAQARKRGDLNMKLPAKEYKTMKSYLGFKEAELNNVFKEGKIESTVIYKSKIRNLKKVMVEKVRKLKKDKTISSDKLRAEIDWLNRNHKKDLLRIASEAKELNDLKRIISEQFVQLKKEKDFIGDAERVAFRKIVNSSQLDSATTPIQLEKAVDSINKALVTEYRKALKQAIIDKLKFKNVKKGSSVYERKKLTPSDRDFLEKANILFNESADSYSLEVIEDLYTKIKADVDTKLNKAKGVTRKAKEEISKTIGDIEKEGVVNAKGLEDIIDGSVSQKTIGALRSWANKISFMPRHIDKIFGKHGTAYKVFVTEPNRQYVRFERFFQNNTMKVAENLFTLFGKDTDTLKEFGSYFFTIRAVVRNGEKYFPGLERIKLDKTSLFFKERVAPIKFDKVPDDFPLSQSQWDEVNPINGKALKDTKLGEIFEKYNSKEYKLASNLMNKYNEIIFPKIQKTSLETEGFSEIPSENYMAYLIRDGKIDTIDLDFGGKNYVQDKINDSFTNGLADGATSRVYEYNPVEILLTSGRKQVYYAHMKKPYETIRQVLAGTDIKLTNTPIDTIEKKVKSGEYKMYNKNREVIDIDSFELTEDGLVRVRKATESGKKKTEDPSENIDFIDMNDVTIKGNRGVAKGFNNETNKIINDYIGTISSGGNVIKSRTDALFNKVMSQANILPLMGNASVVLKQAGSYIDAFYNADIGAKNLLQATKEMGSDMDLFLRIRKLTAVEDRIGSGGDWILKQGRSYSGKVGNTYSSYKEVLLGPMKQVDGLIYGNVFYGAYKKYLQKNGLNPADSYKLNNYDALNYAEDIANRVTSTANPLWLPNAYKNVYFKQFFGIGTTQLNRVQEYLDQSRNALVTNDVKRFAIVQSGFFIANAMEITIGLSVGKFLFDNGFSTYDKYGEDFMKSFMSINTAYQLSIGQFFFGNKISGFLAGFQPSPLLSYADKIQGDMQRTFDNLTDGKPNAEKLPMLVLKTLTDMFGGKIASDIMKKYKAETE